MIDSLKCSTSLNYEETVLESDKMEAFKIIYQKNRNENKPLKMQFDELGYYHQFLEEEITVKSFTKNLNKKS